MVREFVFSFLLDETLPKRVHSLRKDFALRVDAVKIVHEGLQIKNLLLLLCCCFTSTVNI